MKIRICVIDRNDSPVGIGLVVNASVSTLEGFSNQLGLIVLGGDIDCLLVLDESGRKFLIINEVAE